MGWYSGDYGRFAPYVSVAQRRANAAREVKKLQAKGRTITPVQIEGRQIAQTFWGKGWCDHMESFHDFANRLPRGRAYVRNGSVVDLQMKPGKITALVAGSSLYKIDISIEPLGPELWRALKGECSGKIASLLELLKGGVSAAVMRVMSDREKGMFPRPGQIRMRCSCPDMAGMCKHLAAVFYGVGARLDREPELLFRLRGVDPGELIACAADAVSETIATRKKVIAEDALADVFGIELETRGDRAHIAPRPPARTSAAASTSDASASAVPSPVALPLSRGTRPVPKGKKGNAPWAKRKAPGSGTVGSLAGATRTGAKERAATKRRRGGRKKAERMNGKME